MAALRFEVLPFVWSDEYGLIPNLVRLLLPFDECRQGFCAEKLFHDEFAFANRQGDFAVDLLVVESNPRRVLPCVAIIQAAQTGPVDRRKTHRARFATRVKIAILKAKRLQPLAS